jgi:hypothetical protein
VHREAGETIKTGWGDLVGKLERETTEKGGGKMNTIVQVSQPWRERFAVEFLPERILGNGPDLPPVPDFDDFIGPGKMTTGVRL